MRVLIDVKSLLTNFMDQIGSLPTLFNDFHFLTPPTGGSRGSFRGQIWPKNDFLCHIIHLDHPKSPFKHYWPTLCTRYNTSRPFSMIFTFWSSPTGGHGGHLGVRFGRKMEFCAILSISITLNRRLNTIDGLYAQDLIPPDPFQWFLLFDPTHWGVTGSFRGQIWHFLLYYPFGSP